MRKVFFLLLLIVFSFPAVGADFSDIYADIGESTENIDPNAGLTIFPILLIPAGGRLESMGTAFTALADDAGYLEANPSASSVMKHTELTFNHNNWIADSNLEGITYTVRFNNFGLGFGGKFLYLPFTEYNDWGERQSKGYYTETVATVNVSYNFFSNYYFHGLAVGINVKAAYRSIPEAIYPEQSAIGIMADVGLLTRFNFLKFYASRDKNFSVGLAMKNMGPLVLGEPLPTAATAGIAYSPLRPLVIAFDFTYPISFFPEFPAETWGLASGLEVVITDFFAVQGGFRYRGSNPRISLGASVDLSWVSFQVNYTLDMTTQLGNVDRFSLAAALNLGDRGRKERRDRVDELYALGMEAYAKGELETAIRLWEEALALDPGFVPARSNMELAKNAINLQEEMESIQSIE
jgi:hypothetical protein